MAFSTSEVKLDASKEESSEEGYKEKIEILRQSHEFGPQADCFEIPWLENG